MLIFVPAQKSGLLTLPVPDYLHEMLIDNLLAWMQTAGPDLAAASAEFLPTISPSSAIGPLGLLAENDKRPIEARLAAIRSLGAQGESVTTDYFGTLLSDRAQQVRLVVLHEIKKRATKGDSSALACLVQAVDRTVLDEQHHIQPQVNTAAADVAMPKAQPDTGLRISEDGEILRGDGKGDAGGSTLAALQMVSSEEKTEGHLSSMDDPVQRTPKSKRRRISIQGPDAVAEDLACAAMDAALGLESIQISNAVLTHLTSAEDRTRITAWRVLSTDFPASHEVTQAARLALSNDLPEVRRYALAVLIKTDQLDKFLMQALDDTDALVRCDAVMQLRGKKLLDFVADPSAPVRKAALTGAWDSSNIKLCAQANSQAFASERQDTIAWALQHSPEMSAEAARRLSSDTESRSAYVILNALSSC